MVAAVESLPRSDIRLVAPAAPVAASYERVSTLEQARHGYSLDGQRRTLEAFAQAEGYALLPHLQFRDGEDADASGTRWDLPGLTAMLEAASRREFSVLLVTHSDRLSRKLGKLLALKEQLRRYGVRVVRPGRPTDDSPETELGENMEGVIAEYERARILYRTLGGKVDKARRGEVVGSGFPPYGYRYTRRELANGKMRVVGLESDPLTASTARDVLRALRFRSTVDVMADLNDRGVPGPGGRRWNTTVLHRIARNPVYSGTWLYGWRSGHAEPIPVAVPPLMDRAEWEDLQRALDGRRRHRAGRRSAQQDPWTLRSRLRCGLCGGVLRTKTNNAVRYYACERHMPSAARRKDKPVCALPDVHAADLEGELWRKLETTLFDPGFLGAALAAGVAQHQQADRLRRDRLAAIDAELAKHRRRLDGLVDELADLGPESREAVRRRMQDAEAVIVRLAAERDDLAAVRSDGLSREEADDVEAFAAELAAMHAALTDATPAELRELIDVLDVRGAVYSAPKGIALGRKHRFVIDWTARIRLSDKGTPLSRRVRT
jgi:site-specific DNA recombinase